MSGVLHCIIWIEVHTDSTLREFNDMGKKDYEPPKMETLLLTSSQEILLTNNSIENPAEDKEEWPW